MALARWQRSIVDELGNVLPSASVEVRIESSNTLASLYSDRDGLVAIGNPFSADSEGFAAFHVVGDAYKVTVTSGAYSRVWRYVAIGTAQETDLITSVDNTIARFDGVSGRVQASSATVNDDGSLTLTSVDTGSVGPLIVQYHNSASPAASDIIGGIWPFGEDSAGNQQEYGALYCVIEDATSGSEDSRWDLYTYSGGSASGMGFYPGGIKFPATQIASTGNNTLDDYEEGSWSPTITGSSSNPAVTYTSQVGNYTKVGNVTYFQGYVILNSFSGGSGDVQISLPSTASAFDGPFMVATNGVSWTGDYLNGYILSAVANFVLAATVNNASSNTLAVASYASGDQIYFQGNYR